MDNTEDLEEFKSSRASCPARRVDPPCFESLEREGDFYIIGDALHIWLPGLSKFVGLARVPVQGPNAWNWDGNVDRPTLSPSIKLSKKKQENPDDPPEKWREIELWHGHLKAGQLESC